MARLVYDLRNAVMAKKDAERQAILQRTLAPYIEEQVRRDCLAQQDMPPNLWTTPTFGSLSALPHVQN